MYTSKFFARRYFAKRYWNAGLTAVIGEIAPQTGAIVAAGVAPALVKAFSPSSGTVTLTGFAPSIAVTLSGITGSVSAAGQVPAISRVLAVSTGATVAAGASPTLAATLAPVTGAVAATGLAASLTTTLAAVTGAATVSGAVPGLSVLELIALEPGNATVAVAGNIPGMPLPLSPASGAIAVSGNEPTVDRQFHEFLYPDGIAASSNTTGAYTLVNESPASPDSLWITANAVGTATDVRFTFPTPTSSPIGPQKFYYQLRKTPGANNPTATVELWQGGVFRKTLQSGVSITPAGTDNLGQTALYSYTWGNLQPTAEVVSNTGLRQWCLSFILADAGGNPLWDGWESLSAAGRVALIDEIRATGGDVMVSYGGQTGTKLILVHTTTAGLAAAYQAPISKYNLRSIEMDIEGAEASCTTAQRQRAIDALKVVAANNPGLRIHMIIASGTQDGPDAISIPWITDAQARGLEPFWTVMPIYFGSHTGTMAQASIDMVNGWRDQLMTTYGYTQAQAYAKLGITSMNGYVDVTETITHQDFYDMLAFVRANKLARFTYWSLNRDRECDATNTYENAACAGAPQSPYDFTKIQASYFDGQVETGEWDSGDLVSVADGSDVELRIVSTPGAAITLGALPALNTTAGTLLSSTTLTATNSVNVPAHSAGDLLVLQVLCRDTNNNGTLASIGTAGWQQSGGPGWMYGGAQNARIGFAWKIGDGSESAVSITTSGGTGTPRLLARVYRFTAANGFADNPIQNLSTTVALPNGNVGSGTSVTMPAVVPGGSTQNKLAVAIVGVSVSTAAASATGETGGNWTESVAESAATNGTIAIQTSDQSAGTTVTGGTFAVTSGNWISVGFCVVPRQASLATTVEIGAVEWDVGSTSAISLNAISGAAQVVGYAPSKTLSLAGQTGAANAIGQAPGISRILQAVTGAASVAGNAPALVLHVRIAPETGVATASGNVAALSTSLIAVSGASTAAGNIASLSLSLQPVPGAALLTGNIPNFGGYAVIAPTAGQTVAAGAAPAIVSAISATTGTLTTAGGNPALSSTLAGVSGSAVVAGAFPTLAGTGVLSPGTAVVATTGNAPSLRYDFRLTPTQGVVTTAGDASGIARLLTPQVAPVAATGQQGGLTRALNPTSGIAFVSGNAPSLAYQGQIVPATAAVAATGQSPSIVSTLLPTLGTLQITGNAPEVAALVFIELLPATGVATAIGNAPAITHGKQPLTGTTAAAGLAPALSFGILPQPGPALLTGLPPERIVSLILEPETGTTTLAGEIAGLMRALGPSSAPIAFLGLVPGLERGIPEAPGIPYEIMMGVEAREIAVPLEARECNIPAESRELTILAEIRQAA